MNRYIVLAAPLFALTLNACGSGFAGPPRPIRLSHIDGATAPGEFVCENGVFTSGSRGTDTQIQYNLSWNFSSKVCASISDQDDGEAVDAMVDSGVTLIRTRCADFFAAKQTNQTRSRLVRSLIQPLTIAITSTFSVLEFGSERQESDALALLAAGNALANAGLDVYEDQFLFGADNVYSVQAMTMRALSAHQANIDATDLPTFDAGVRALLDHQSICTPGNILELVRAAIDNGDFRARQTGEGIRQTGADETDEGTIELTLPPVG